MLVKIRIVGTFSSFHSMSAGLLLVLLLIDNFVSFCNSMSICEENFSHENTTRPEITIPHGTLRGINMRTRHNRSIFGFMGIPYARPPIGDLRFQAPVPSDPWNVTLDASNISDACIQVNEMQRLIGIEDCLYLNTYTPQLPSRNDSTLLPVMMYIYGGRFKSGANECYLVSPGFLLDKDVILVVPNYRVGVLGFLTTGDEVSPGNYGLKDMVRALEWIQDNIKYFGGDPNRVTLFGGSSGAMSVHILALSKLTDGLFHRYITQSGSAFCNSVNQPKEVSVNRAYKLAEHFGCSIETSTHLVNCLKKLSSSRIVDTYELFHEWGTYPSNVWLPTVEPDIKGALLTDTPANLYAARKFHDLPWIATVNRDEGLNEAMRYRNDPELFDDVLENIDFVLPHLLEYKYLVNDVPAYTSALKSYYLNDLTADRNLLLLNFTNLLGDSVFLYPVYKAIRQHLALAESSRYFGLLAFTGTYSFAWLFYNSSDKYPGASHGDELIYLLGYRNDIFGPPDFHYTEADFIIVDTMVQLWTSFASSGTPTIADSNGTAIWERYSQLNNYLRIGNGFETGMEMKYNLYMERMQFWDELGKTTVTSGEFQNTLEILPIAFYLCLISYI